MIRQKISTIWTWVTNASVREPPTLLILLLLPFLFLYDHVGFAVHTWRIKRAEAKASRTPQPQKIWDYLNDEVKHRKELQHKVDILAGEIVNLGNSLNKVSYKLAAKMNEVDELRQQLDSILIENSQLKEGNESLSNALRQDRFSDLDV